MIHLKRDWRLRAAARLSLVRGRGPRRPGWRVQSEAAPVTEDAGNSNYDWNCVCVWIDSVNQWWYAGQLTKCSETTNKQLCSKIIINIHQLDISNIYVSFFSIFWRWVNPTILNNASNGFNLVSHGSFEKLWCCDNCDISKWYHIR